jgi:putative spermidine/putrescine transport system permease protein
LKCAAFPFWSWLWIALGFLYFFLPLYATLQFSLRAQRDTLSLLAYQRVLDEPEFFRTFLFSVQMALWTIFASIVLIVPTAFWVHLRLPRLRPFIELVTLMPFVIPGVVLVFGLIRTYSRPPFPLVSSPALLVAGYTVLALPYMYRAVDTGLRAVDVRTLTEAALSLGANWPTILLRVILPNLRVALLSGAFLTFAIVIGEFTLAALLSWPAFGPYLARLQQDRAYEPAALAILSFALTWGAMLLIQWLGRGRQGQQSQLTGTH